MFTVTHVNGTMEQGTDGALPGLLAELAAVDREHTDVAVQHESGWTLSVFPSRRIVLENIGEDEEEGERPRSTQMPSDEECLRAMRTVASGALDDLDYAAWEVGYGTN